jgi:hypothetical protein
VLKHSKANYSTPCQYACCLCCLLRASQEQHLDLLAACCVSELAATSTLGLTLDGRTMDMVTIGDGPLNVWAIARQVSPCR